MIRAKGVLTVGFLISWIRESPGVGRRGLQELNLNRLVQSPSFITTILARGLPTLFVQVLRLNRRDQVLEAQDQVVIRTRSYMYEERKLLLSR